MPRLITVKIDVTKLDKARFFRGKPDKNGHAPLYADLVLVPRKEVGQYGDTHIVKQSKKKDEQVEMPIIGSGQERGGESSVPAPRPETTTTVTMSDDAPF